MSQPRHGIATLASLARVMGRFGFEPVAQTSTKANRAVGKIYSDIGRAMAEVVTDTSMAAEGLLGEGSPPEGYRSRAYPNQSIFFITKTSTQGQQFCFVTLIDRENSGPRLYVRAEEFIDKVLQNGSVLPSAVFASFHECKRAPMTELLKAGVATAKPFTH
jgi:hypothetical protein